VLLIGVYDDSGVFDFGFLLLLKLLTFFLAVEGFLDVDWRDFQVLWALWGCKWLVLGPIAGWRAVWG
jgi:hypothetical protein